MLSGDGNTVADTTGVNETVEDAVTADSDVHAPDVHAPDVPASDPTAPVPADSESAGSVDVEDDWYESLLAAHPPRPARPPVTEAEVLEFLDGAGEIPVPPGPNDAAQETGPEESLHSAGSAGAVGATGAVGSVVSDGAAGSASEGAAGIGAAERSGDADTDSAAAADSSGADSAADAGSVADADSDSSGAADSSGDTDAGAAGVPVIEAPVLAGVVAAIEDQVELLGRIQTGRVRWSV